MTRIFAKIQRPSLRWGLIFGIILGVVATAYNFALNFVQDQSAQGLLQYFPALLFIVLSFYAGLRASQETRKWTSGLVAGIWVGVIGAVITEIIPTIYILVNMQNVVASYRVYIKTHPVETGNIDPAKFTSSDVLTGMAENILVGIIGTSLYTVIGGGLGGFIGRRRALAAGESEGAVYQETMFEPPASPGVEETSKISDSSVPEAEATSSTDKIAKTTGKNAPKAPEAEAAEPAEVKDEAK